MTTEEFLERARNEISNDPKSRLTALAKTNLEDDNCLVDIHTHIFDKKCLSIGYILLRMMKSLALKSLGLESTESALENMEFAVKTEEDVYTDLAAGVQYEDADWEKFESEIETTAEVLESLELFGFNVRDAFKVIKKKNMLEVLEYYHDSFSVVNLDRYKHRKMVTGILQMDLETGWGFSPKRDFKQQIKDLKEITKKEAILPYIALDPRRVEASSEDGNLLELFLDVFTDPETPFFGVKCYPALGYMPYDIRLDPIFQICAEKNIPVLTHCGGETVSQFEKRITVKDENGYSEIEVPGDSRKERARYLNEPDHWIKVLNKHPNLKLNLGHFGGDESWQNMANNGSDERVEKIYEMMRNPNYKVYGDFSFNVIEDELFESFKKEMDTHADIAKRALYGTDYWVVLPSGDLLDEQDEFLQKMVDHEDAMMRDNMREYLFG